MLGFADARDLFWTTACEDSQSTGPRALHVTLVDHEAACLSRLLVVMDLFLELQPHSSLDQPPQPGEWGNLDSPPHPSEAVPEWVTTIWSLLFNHFILYGQREVLRACARRLLVAMETPETWAQSRMGQIVTWMTEETAEAVRELLVKYADSPVIEREAFRKARRKVLEKTPVGKYSKKGRFSKLPVIYRGPAACMMETLTTHEDYGTALCDYLTTGNIDVSILGVTAASSRAHVADDAVGNPALVYTSQCGDEYAVHYASLPFDAFHGDYGRANMANARTLAKDVDWRVRMLSTSLNQLALWGRSFGRVATGRSRMSLRVGLAHADALHYCQAAQVARHRWAEAGDPAGSITFRTGWAPGQLSGISLRHATEPYDVISTSNLADSLGTLHLLLLAGPLLRRATHATLLMLYMATPHHHTGAEVFVQKQIGMDLLSAALLLGLAPVDWMIGGTAWNHQFLPAVGMKMLMGSQMAALPLLVCWRAPALLTQPSEAPNSVHGVSSFHRITISPEDFAGIALEAYKAVFSHQSAPGKLLSGGVEQATEQMAIGAKNPTNTPLTFILLLAHARKQLVLDSSHFHAALHTVDTKSGLMLQTNMCQEMYLWSHLFGLHSEHWLLRDPIQQNHAEPQSPTLSKELVDEGWPSYARIVMLVPRREIEKNFGPTAAGGPTPPLEAYLTSGMKWANMYQCLSVAFVGSKAKTAGGGSCDDGEGWIDAKNFYVRPASSSDPDAEVLVSFLCVSANLAMENPVDITVSLRHLSYVSPKVMELTRLLGFELMIYKTTLGDKRRTAVLRPGQLPHTLFTATPTLLPPPPPSTTTTAAGIEGSSTTNATADLHIIPPASSSSGVERQRLRAALRNGALSVIDHIDLTGKTVKSELTSTSGVNVEQWGPPGLVVVISPAYKVHLPYPFPVSIDQTRVQFSRKRFFVELTLQAASHPRATCIFDTTLAIERSEGGHPREPSLCSYSQPRVPLPLLVPLDGASNSTWVNTLVSCSFDDNEGKQHLISGLKGGSGLVDLKTSFHTLWGTWIGINNKVTAQKAKDVVFQCVCGEEGVHMLLHITSMRLDPTNFSLALDCSVLPLTLDIVHSMGPQLANAVNAYPPMNLNMSEAELRLWKQLLPMAVERARTGWTHTSSCEYVREGVVPLPGWEGKGGPPICSCGRGKNVPEAIVRMFGRKLSQHFYRALLSPCFAPNQVHRPVDVVGGSAPPSRVQAAFERQASDMANSMDAYKAMGPAGLERLREALASAGGGGERESTGGGNLRDMLMRMMVSGGDDGGGGDGGGSGGADSAAAGLSGRSQTNSGRPAGSQTSTKAASSQPSSAPARSTSGAGGGSAGKAAAVCVVCGRSGKMRRCSACKGVSYCGPECQRADWPSHKKQCSRSG